jgi:cell division protein FtsB
MAQLKNEVKSLKDEINRLKARNEQLEAELSKRESLEAVIGYFAVF